MSTPHVTMFEIARRAGVHPATVSRALRDDRRISTARREHIRQIARSLGYRKNPLVAALMTIRRARNRISYRATLALVTNYPPARASFFRAEFGQLLDGARERARALGYEPEEFNTRNPIISGSRLSAILQHRGIHGLIIAPLHSIRDAMPLDWSAFATVAVGYSLHQVGVSRVAHNHFNGLALALRQTHATGYRRPGFVLSRRVHEKVEKRWLAAYLLDQAEHTAPAIPPLLHDDVTEAAFNAWFRRHQPDVIFCINVTLLQPWLARLGARGRRIGLVSLDRRPRDRGVAGIDQAYPLLGAAAVDTVIGMLHRNETGLPALPPTLLLDGRWVDGRSLPPLNAAAPTLPATPARAPAG